MCIAIVKCHNLSQQIFENLTKNLCENKNDEEFMYYELVSISFFV